MGKDAAKFLEKICAGDILSLKPGEGKLNLIMNETGGIVDDTVISNAGHYM
jgi:aminomethyltransferase